MTTSIQSLHVYPIKSLAGISLREAQCTPTGIKWDRHWMMIDADNKMISQREIPRLATIQTSITGDDITITNGSEAIAISGQPLVGKEVLCQLFDQKVWGTVEGSEINTWFSDQLHQSVRLVRMSTKQPREVDRHPGTKVNFSDSQQYLVTSQASLDLLNSKLETAIPMDRFRPNIVITGTDAHEEDEWTSFSINENKFLATKICGRCKITTIDQTTGIMGVEPLPTLATYRRMERKIAFGSYFKNGNESNYKIRVGDELMC